MSNGLIPLGFGKHPSVRYVAPLPPYTLCSAGTGCNAPDTMRFASSGISACAVHGSSSYWIGFPRQGVGGSRPFVHVSSINTVRSACDSTKMCQRPNATINTKNYKFHRQFGDSIHRPRAQHTCWLLHLTLSLSIRWAALFGSIDTRVASIGRMIDSSEFSSQCVT